MELLISLTETEENYAKTYLLLFKDEGPGAVGGMNELNSTISKISNSLN